MGKIVIVLTIAALATFVAVNAAPPKCGENEFYTPPGECAPCEVNCGVFKVPCKTRECRTGCQCFLGYHKVDGVCVNANVCGTPPPGAVN